MLNRPSSGDSPVRRRTGGDLAELTDCLTRLIFHVLWQYDRYAFDSGAIAKPVTLATIPAGPAPDSRNITWAVDKYDRDIAYVDAADAVHVIAP